MKIKLKIFKIMIFFVIFLNLSILIFGNYYLENQLNYEKDIKLDNLDFYIKKRDSIIEELSVIEKSQEDVLSNLKELKSNILFLKSKIGSFEQNFSSSEDERTYYVNLATNLDKQKESLIIERNSLQNEIKSQNQAKITKNTQKVVKTTVPKTTTKAKTPTAVKTKTS